MGEICSSDARPNSCSSGKLPRYGFSPFSVDRLGW